MFPFYGSNKIKQFKMNTKLQIIQKFKIKNKANSQALV